MDMNADYDALLAEVEGLRDEVAQLRKQQAAHVCYAPPNPWLAQTFANTACAAPVPVPQVFTLSPGVSPVNLTCGDLTVGAAGCAPAQTFMVLAGH
jgi:hypothetical protein